jgi:hypothetical protein
MFSITPLPGRTGVGIIPGLPGLPGLVGIGSLVIGFVIGGIGGFGTGLPGLGLFMLGIMK